MDQKIYKSKMKYFMLTILSAIALSNKSEDQGGFLSKVYVGAKDLGNFVVNGTFVVALGATILTYSVFDVIKNVLNMGKEANSVPV